MAISADTVERFVLEHNYELLILQSTSLLCGHRGVICVQKKLILTLNEYEVPTRKIMLVLSKELCSDFNIDCIGNDVKNYLRNKMKKLFEERESQKLYGYFLD